MKRIIACLLALLPSIALAQQPDSYKLLKAAAIGIVANQSCPSPIFDNVMIVSWLFTGSRDSGLTQDEGIEATRIYVAMILSSLKTREQLHAFCRSMVSVMGEPT